MNILLTGATGFVGKRLIKELIVEGHELYLLVRSEYKYQTLLESLSKSDAQKVHAIYGDITSINLGISQLVADDLKHNIDAIYHMAALLSFDENRKDETFRINVEGTKNVLEFAKAIAVTKFIYVSTAYTLGKKTYASETLHNTNGLFVNPYEESKCATEHLALEYNKYFEVSIMRPSIIIGDSVTGEADTTFALYGLLRGLKLLKRKVSKQDNWQETNYRLKIEPKTASNIVPVDYVAKVLALGLKYAEANKIYHITNPNPPSHESVFELIREVLDFPNLELSPHLEPQYFSEMELFLNSPLSVFHEYWDRTITFEIENTKELLSSAGEKELDLTLETLKKIISTFVADKVAVE
ncbi:SDR family oxidoreductase [Lottiidibacillus patelloidae]|nr:SDR family oxidoreductase [Lottiidibacillus patelloidae]